MLRCTLYLLNLLGPVVRIGPDELHINDPEVFQDISKVRSHFMKDPEFYNYAMLPGTSISLCDPAKHRVRRLVLAPAFSPMQVAQSTPMVQDMVRFLMGRFEQLATQGRTINITTSTKALTMDIISKVVFGKELGCIRDSGFSNPFMEFLHASEEGGWVCTSFPNLFRLALKMPTWLSNVVFPIPIQHFKNVNKVLYSATVSPADHIQKCNHLISDYLQRRKDPTRRASKENDHIQSLVIDMLLDPDCAKDHSILDDDQIACEMIMLLTAGTDTTSAAMIIGLYQILKNADIRNKLSSELISSFPELEKGIAYEDAKELRYLVSPVTYI